MHPRNIFVIFAATLAFLGCTHRNTKSTSTSISLDNTPKTNKVHYQVWDAQLRNRFRKTLTAAYHAGVTTPASELRKQMSAHGKYRINTLPQRQNALSGDALYNICQPSTLIVGFLYKCGQCDDWHMDLASGYAIDTDVIITSSHVISDPRSKAFGVMDSTGQLYPVTELLADAPNDDVAIARVLIPKGAKRLSPAPISQSPTIGSQVYVISHPSGQFYSLTEGMVSRYVSNKNSTRMSITADYAIGSSGAPVFDQYGNVCGMATSTEFIYAGSPNSASKSHLQMVIKSCVPSASVTRIINQTVRN